MKTIKTYIAIAISLLTFSGMIAQNKTEVVTSINTTSSRMSALDLINYQAVARDASGALITNAAITITFEIIEGVGGPVIFNETQSLNTDANGVFSAQIGAVNSLSGIQWDLFSAYLRVGLNGTNVGETQMVSVPYALFANDADHAYYADTAGTVINGVENLNDLTDAKTNNGGTIYIGTSAGLNDNFSNELYNVGIGYESIKSNTSGSRNVGFGYQTLAANTTGSYNTAIGTVSLFSNTTGSNNTATGHYAMRDNTTGANNTASGYYAMKENSAGNSNAAYGFEALKQNTGGSNNTAIGRSALTNNTASNNTAIGYNAMGGATSANGENNTAIGFEALKNLTTGRSNTAIGLSAGSNLTTGDKNIIIGWNAQVANAAGDFQVQMGSSSVTTARIQVPWTITSDRRFKNNIETSNLGLSFVNELKPVFYERNNDEKHKTEYGFVAQEVEATLKEFEATNTGIINVDDAGMYSVRYNDFIAVLTKAIQEQQEIIDNLQATLGSQQTIIKDQDSKIESLSASLEQNLIESKDFDNRLRQLETKL